MRKFIKACRLVRAGMMFERNTFRRIVDRRAFVRVLRRDVIDVMFTF